MIESSVIAEKPEHRPLSRPVRSKVLIQSTVDSVNLIGDAILSLDITIELWNKFLMKAQPLDSGRIAIMFIKNRPVRMHCARDYEVEPVVGKMVEMKSGRWRFVRLTKRDVYAKLSDLRVGKSMVDDGRVVKLLDGLQDLLERRKYFVNLLLALRSGASGPLLGNARFCEQYSERAFDIGAKIKLDWSGNAKASRQSIRDSQRRRAQAKRTKAIAISTGNAACV